MLGASHIDLQGSGSIQFFSFTEIHYTSTFLSFIVYCQRENCQNNSSKLHQIMGFSDEKTIDSLKLG